MKFLNVNPRFFFFFWLRGSTVDGIGVELTLVANRVRTSLAEQESTGSRSPRAFLCLERCARACQPALKSPASSARNCSDVNSAGVAGQETQLKRLNAGFWLSAKAAPCCLPVHQGRWCGPTESSRRQGKNWKHKTKPFEIVDKGLQSHVCEFQGLGETRIA